MVRREQVGMRGEEVAICRRRERRPVSVEDVAALDVVLGRHADLRRCKPTELGSLTELPVRQTHGEQAGKDGHNDQQADKAESTVRPTEHRSAGGNTDLGAERVEACLLRPIDDHRLDSPAEHRRL